MWESVTAFLVTPVVCYYLFSKVPAGASRLIAVLPFFYCLGVVPLQLASLSALAPKLLASTLFLVVPFISGFKLIGWAINRGPLAVKMNFLQFMIMFLCPVFPAAGKPGEDTSLDNTLTLITKHVLLQIVSALVVFYPLSPLALNIGNALSFLLLLNITLDLSLPLIQGKFPQTLVPAFSAPWKARSYREFWSFRWNRPVAGLLREVVFKPIMEGSLVPRQPPLGQAAAKAPANSQRVILAHIATFAVSGLMHEWCLWIGCGRFPGYHMIFFLLQVPAIYLQELVLSRVPPSIRSRSWFQLLQTVWTVSSLMWIAELFWLGNLRCHRPEVEMELRDLMTSMYAPLLERINTVPVLKAALASVATSS